MKRSQLLVIAALLLTTAIWAAVAEKPRFSRASLVAMEKSFDGRIRKISIDDPFDLLGNTRGIYLEGYGAVFTTEVNLVAGPTITPFHLTISKEEASRMRQKKVQRVPVLKDKMRDMLVASAASLDSVPPKEQIALGVSLFYFSWEDTAGLPSQILMQAERQKLLDVHVGRVSRAALDNIVRVQEF